MMARQEQSASEDTARAAIDEARFFNPDIPKVQNQPGQANSGTSEKWSSESWMPEDIIQHPSFFGQSYEHPIWDRPDMVNLAAKSDKPSRSKPAGHSRPSDPGTYAGENAPVRPYEVPAPDEKFKYRPLAEPRDEQLGDLIRQVAKAQGIDPVLFQRLIQVESEYNPYATSPSGKHFGLGQISLDLCRDHNVTDPFNPNQNLTASAKEMKRLLDKYRNDWSKAVWAYNAGQGNCDNGRLPSEARNQIVNMLLPFQPGFDEASFSNSK